MQDPVFAVMLAEKMGRYVLLTINGRIVTVSQASLLWHLPRWLDPARLAPLSPYHPSDAAILADGEDIKVHEFGVPREASAPIITALNEFRNRINTIYRRHASVLDNAHELLADKVELQFGTLTRIAQKLIGTSEQEMTPEVLYTVRKALHRHPLGFNSLRRVQRRSQLWQVRPKSMVEDVRTARIWLRQYRDAVSFDSASDPRQASTQKNAVPGYAYVDRFVKTCRKIIAESRKTRPFNKHGLGPDKSGEPFGVSDRKLPTFTHEESVLLRFVQYWCLQEAFEQDQSLTGLPPYLIQAIGMYNEVEPGKNTGKLLLQELGCLPPYADFHLLSPGLMLPGHGLSARLDSIWSTILKTSNSSKIVDSMKSLRHDWGDLPVYCIDPEGTTDIDDGLSIEAVQGQADQYWLRVHVANPTAFIPPDSNVSAMARQLTTSLYTPEETLHMLPPVYQDICSLKSGAPTFTISIRLDRDANVLQQDIRPGRIHNVHRLSYEAVDVQLGLKADTYVTGVGSLWQSSKPLIVGASPAKRLPPSPAPSTSLDERHRSNLQTLYRLAQSLYKRRSNQSSSLGGHNPHLSIIAYSPNRYPPSNADVKTLFQDQRGVVHRGDPVIEVQGFVTSPQLFYAGSPMNAHSMVAEAMVTAGVAAATWSWDRKIPQPYRTQMLRLSSEEVRNARLAVTNSPAQKGDIAQFSWNDALSAKQIQELLLPAFVLARPAHHAALGVTRYIKATSPLRRYSDMLTHWQIEAALRHEASSSKRLVADGDFKSVLPFTHNTMDALLGRLLDREKTMQQAQKDSERLWISRLFHRAFYHPSSNQTQCPELTAGVPFRVVATSTMPRFHAPYGMQGFQVVTENQSISQSMLCDHKLLADTRGIELYDVWECVLHDVSPVGGNIFVKALRLLQRCDEDVLEAYHRNHNRLAKLSAKVPEME